MYSNIITVIDKIHMYLLCFNILIVSYVVCLGYVVEFQTWRLNYGLALFEQQYDIPSIFFHLLSCKVNQYLVFFVFKVFCHRV